MVFSFNMGYTQSSRTRNKIRARRNHWIYRLLRIVGVTIAVTCMFGLGFAPSVQAAASDVSAIYQGAMPVDVIFQETDPRFRWPFVTFGISQYFAGYHSGIDLTNPEGTPIYPIAEGTVIEVNAFFDGYGRHVIVQHDDDLTSLYAHMSKVHAVVGQKVDLNTKLGEVGATGWATGNHLHLEIRKNGVSQNPIGILPQYKIGDVYKSTHIIPSTPSGEKVETAKTPNAIVVTEVITQAIAPPPIPSLSL